MLTVKGVQAAVKSQVLLTVSATGHKRSELEAFHDANSSETGGLTRILWVGSAEEMEKHAYVVEVCYKGFSFLPFFASQIASLYIPVLLGVGWGGCTEGLVIHQQDLGEGSHCLLLVYLIETVCF